MRRAAPATSLDGYLGGILSSPPHDAQLTQRTAARLIAPMLPATLKSENDAARRRWHNRAVRVVEFGSPGRFVHGGACVLALVCLIRPFSAEAHPGPLHIDQLRASVTTSNGVRSVNVRARVCVRSATEATSVVPDQFRLTQFIVYKGRWRPVRSVIEYTPWIVSLGEAWGGTPCGWVPYTDAFRWPEGFAGFGSTINCFGVSFSLKVGNRTATKRIAIKCPNA
jgi:hypothetical protein